MLLVMTESGDTELTYTWYQRTCIDELGIPLYADLYYVVCNNIGDRTHFLTVINHQPTEMDNNVELGLGKSTDCPDHGISLLDIPEDRPKDDTSLAAHIANFPAREATQSVCRTGLLDLLLRASLMIG